MSLIPKAINGTPATVRKPFDDFGFTPHKKTLRVRIPGIPASSLKQLGKSWKVSHTSVRRITCERLHLPASVDGSFGCQITNVASRDLEVRIHSPEVSTNLLEVVLYSEKDSCPQLRVDSDTICYQLISCVVSKNLVERSTASDNLVTNLPTTNPRAIAQEPWASLVVRHLAAQPSTPSISERAIVGLPTPQQDVVILSPLHAVGRRVELQWLISKHPQVREFNIRFEIAVIAFAKIPSERITVHGVKVRFSAAFVFGTDLRQLPAKPVSQPINQPPKKNRKSYSPREASSIAPHRSRNTTNGLLKLLLPILRLSIESRLDARLDLPGLLRHYQVDGIHRLVSNRVFLLADEMGTGKTVMAIVATRILIQRGAVLRVLVMCPKSVLSVWESHLKKWAPDLMVSVAYGNPDSRDSLWNAPAHVYLTTYDIVMKDIKGSIPFHHQNNFDLIVADEAHTLKNPSTQRSQAARSIESKYRWALTGTPIQNSVDEMVSLFRFLKSDLFPEWMRDGYSTSPAVVRGFIEPYFLRRRKIDVMPELPPKIYSDEWFELDRHQKREYADVLKKFQMCKASVTRIEIFAVISKLKQICNFATGHQSSPKSEALVDQVSEIISSGQKVIVFSQYVEAGVAKLRPLLTKYGLSVLTGSVSHSERQRLVQKFQEDESQQVFLATTKTAGEGITLTAGSYIIHFDHWWNPAVQWQAEDRAHRIGQSQPVNIYNYWVTDTIEQQIRELLEKKGLLHQQYVEAMAEADFERAISTEDLCGMLGIDVSRLTR